MVKTNGSGRLSARQAELLGHGAGSQIAFSDQGEIELAEIGLGIGQHSTRTGISTVFWDEMKKMRPVWMPPESWLRSRLKRRLPGRRRASCEWVRLSQPASDDTELIVKGWESSPILRANNAPLLTSSAKNRERGDTDRSGSGGDWAAMTA